MAALLHSVWFIAAIGASLMLLVSGGYLLAALRFPVLFHPLVIVVAVTVVGVLVAVFGELLFRGGWAGVPAMTRRSAIGSVGWGVIIAAAVWGVRRAIAMRRT